MIHYRIWGEEDGDVEPGDKAVFLRLIEESTMAGIAIVLAAVDEKTGETRDGWRIVRLLPNGRWIRYSNLDPSLGFELTPEGKIVVR